MTSQITEDTQTSAAPRNCDVRGNSIRFYSDSMLRFLVSFVSSSLKSIFFFISTYLSPMTACTGQTTKSSHQTAKVLLKALAKSNSSKLVVTFFNIVVRRSLGKKLAHLLYFVCEHIFQ